MSFHKQNFSQRFQEMGDTAEAIYNQVLPIGRSETFGWRRPKTTMKNMTPMIKHMPDFYAGSGYLVEVMGCGRDLTLKLKLEKYESLKAWNKVQPVTLFVWNSHHRDWFLLDWDGLKKAVAQGRAAGVKAFHDGPEYWPIPLTAVETNARLSGHYDGRS